MKPEKGRTPGATPGLGTPRPARATPPRAARATGFLDLLPGSARERRRLEDTMLATFEAWGYDLVSTPPVELLSTLELGVQPDQLQHLFKFTDVDGRVLALVGERTVPVARVVAGQLQQAPLPLRLCYLGAVVQGHPPAGMRRESFQAGAELVGGRGPVADAEVVAMAVSALTACGLADFQVEVGHVGFFGGIMNGLSEEHRVLVSDALAGRDLVQLEQALSETDLRAAEQETLLGFPALRGGPELLDAAAKLVDNPLSGQALAELAEVYRLLEAHGVADRVNLDLGAVRDFDYYTGVIFEAFTPGLGSPLATGGRYDQLLGRFGVDRPATGVVVFLDRLHQLQEAAATASGQEDHSVVGVAFDGDAAEAIRSAADLRARGARVAMDLEPT